MGLLRRIFRVREIYETTDPLQEFLCISVGMALLSFILGVLIDKYRGYFYILSVISLASILLFILSYLGAIVRAIKLYCCVRKGRCYQGRIVGRTQYCMVRKHVQGRYRREAKLVIEYADGKRYVTCDMRKESIQRIVSADCRVYVYNGMACADDFRCTLFRSKRCIELDTLKFPQEI